MLNYFKIINTTGKPLNNQELLNASYYGKFVGAMRNAFANKNSEFLNEAGDEGD